MRAFVTRSWAFGFATWAAAVSLADGPPAATQQSIVSGGLQEFSHRVFQVTELVLDHHIDPPTRQEMLLCGLKALLGDASPEDLGRSVSDVATEADFVDCLLRYWATANGNPSATGLPISSEEARRRTFLMGVNYAVPGGLEFMSAKESAVERQLAANQYVGIGVALAHSQDANVHQFATVFPRGVAAKAGIEQNEILLAVDGVAIEKLSMQELISRLRGPEGTTVTVKVARNATAEPRELTLIRSVVPRQTVIGNRQLGPERWEIVLPGDQPAGYLNVREIGGSTVAELREYEAELTAKQVNKLILDLRFAHSRELRYATALADALIDGGNAGSVRSRDGRRPVQLDRDCLFRDWRVAVLVAEHTDGYAEWVAAALQKLRGAIVVGVPTRGETRFVLASIELPEGLGVMRLATNVLEGAKTPELAHGPGSLILRLRHLMRRNADQREAVVPDVEVPLVAGEREANHGRHMRLVTCALEALANPPRPRSAGAKDEAAAP